MRRFLPFIVVAALGVVVALAIRDRFRPRPATPAPVPAGDVEVAWIHTTTNPQTWERFVAGVHQMRRQLPGLEVDDSHAFGDQPGAVPEIVVSHRDRPGRLRFRWYKLSSEVGNADWVKALAERDPSPIAFMGGGSSDRAIELARALNDRTEWRSGQRPLLFITTATANTVNDPATGREDQLIHLYPERSYRGCFTNQAMAAAVVDFVWQAPELKPTGHPEPRAHLLAWQDDPYSIDLAVEFDARFREQKGLGVGFRTIRDHISYSVGTFTEPNPAEREVMDRILPDLTANPEERTLLVLPAATQPARRILRAFAADSPLIGQRLVAVTGDGVSFNTVYRDRDVAWPVQELCIPFVFFAHQNPVAWATDPSSQLQPQNATDDVLMFADMVRVIARATLVDRSATDADTLAAAIRASGQSFYGLDGERRTGDGEYVIVVRPQFLEGGRVSREAVYDVYTRRSGRWERVHHLIK